jgi:ATP adenylyltransferase
MAYIQNSVKEPGCIFCNRPQQADGPGNLIVYRGPRAYLILNRYPYTSGHVMIVPFAHAPSIDRFDPATRAEMMELTSRAVEVLGVVYRPEGFNLGANIGDAAGAGVAEHFHLHVVPRWCGDTNFMSAVSATRVMPEALEETYRKVKLEWDRRLVGGT